MGKTIVGKTTDIPNGQMLKATINGKDILIYNIAQTFFATDDTCTHAGASLSEGTLESGKITCGWHKAEFDCKTGTLQKFPAKIRDLQAYKVTVESDNIFVET